MAKNRIKMYWLLLLVLLFTAGAVLSVGEAQARYVTTATWNTVVQQEDKNGVTSDCLEAVSDPAEFIILLGTLDRPQYEIPFTLSSDEEVSGNLQWKVNIPQYASVNMHINDVIITPETTVKIGAGETIEVIMSLSMPETVFTEVRDGMNLSVEVSWDETLHGTFLAQLPAVLEDAEEEDEEETEEPTEATEPPTDVTEPPTDVTEPPTDATEPPTDATEPTTDVTEPPTDATEPTTDVTEPTTDVTEPPTDVTEPPAEETKPTDPAAGVSGFRIPECIHELFGNPVAGLTTNNEASDDETVPEETTEPVAETEPITPDEPDGQSEESADPSEPETPGDETGYSEGESESSEEPAEDPSEPTEPAQEEKTEQTIHLEAVSRVNSSDALSIQITVPENGGTVRLGLATVEEPADLDGESQTVLEKFPRYTRFSLTEGASWFMLYHEDTIALTSETGAMISVQLDLSYVALEQSQVILGAAFQDEAAQISTYTATVIPEPTRHMSLGSRFLSVGMPLEIVIGEYSEDYSLEYTVEMLTIIKSEDGEADTVGYLPVELTEDSLWAELTSGETGTKLILALGETLPPAGTYRVSLKWIFEEVCYAQTQETFFINYSVYTESEETGGAEQ